MYDVGEVLFLFSVKNHKIVPARVSAVTTIKKVSGTEVTHEMEVPGVADKKVVLENLAVEVFRDTASLKEYVNKLLMNQLDDEIASVNALVARSWQSEVALQASEKIQSRQATHTSPEVDGVVQVELEDGLKARVHVPKDLI